MNRWRRVLAVCLAALVPVGAASGGDHPADKRVEHRGEPVQSTPRPAGPTPGHPNPASPSGKPPEKCDPDHGPRPEQTPVVEETTAIVQTRIVIVEAPRPLEITPGYLTFPEVLQDTLGRIRLSGVTACTDPRYPLPSYAFVGIQPAFRLRSDRDTVHLQRLDFEIEADAEWHPSHSLFTLIAGSAAFQIPAAGEDRHEVTLATDAAGGRTYPLSASLSRSGSLATAARYVLSFQFIDAGSGKAPILQPGDAIYLSIDLSPTAPPGYAMPKLLVVAGKPDALSTLLLVEKTGTRTSVVPPSASLDLAVYCSVLHRIPE